MAVFLSQASGEALVFETIFENRLGYATDLVSMGASIMTLDAHRIMIKGQTKLKARELYGPDLRAGLAFIIAALVSPGRGCSPARCVQLTLPRPFCGVITLYHKSS
jgi:UDP-N-acetylglucosamine 1-carboxyvinyltransferase